ncbi:MAG: hypothetical protein HY322_10660 [Betaproteobacteria bacterium]|nr:hypothetical protein [Betaproteobacteria bacterium]
MIFMSQSGLTDNRRAADWDLWYMEHIRIMLTVPGISSAQRFMTDSPDHSPSLAMYTIAGAGVFEDPYYRSVRGLGEWLPLVDRRYYQRNLFSGLDRAPAVASTAYLLVADRPREDAALAELGLTWLVCAGIDRSTALRGIAVVDAPPRPRGGVAVYRPVTKPMHAGNA